MKVGAVRTIINTIKKEFERISHLRSQQLIQQIEDLFDEMPDEEPADKALGILVKNTIATFWREASQIPVTKDWGTNAVVSSWLKLQKNLQETEWDIQRAHHGYFYHCLQFQYNQSGNGIINTDKLMPILIGLCRRIGYAEKDGIDKYPFPFLEVTIQRIEKEKRGHLIEGFSFIATSFAMMFYLLYHHCSKEQWAILPQLIKYRANTTDEEIRSETAMITNMLNSPDKVLALLATMEVYIDGRPLLINPLLSTLPDCIPKSKKKLLDSTIEKRLYYGITHSLHNAAPAELSDSFATVLERDFALHQDQSYPAAINFAMSVNAQFADLPPTNQEQLFSAAYTFSLGQYIKLCESNQAPNPYLWFSHETKSSAAKKLRLQEKGVPTDMSLCEWAATHEGRLHTLKSQFEEHKKKLLQMPNSALEA
ncbi:hypothetical protein [Legionella fallonii]|uniref:Uncharacterized protein n=1 Tax=Legionella fallonii LLAP-10 TaxID=1212491 RepID=A0A098G3U2_9GAMM|nr:hypothetical protein [Legionella fallonii]CEG56150.1 protein of unknown function [Legionella fallonii LLAP-10]